MNFKLLGAGLTAAAIFTAASVSARAADLARPTYKAPSYSSPGYANWSGFYFGVDAGYGFGKSNWDVPAISPSPKGFLGSAVLGYNFQTGLWVWGVEGDFGGAVIKGSADCFGDSCETKNTWLGTARARIGYAGWSNWLPYLTGGMAFGDIQATSPAGSANKTKTGWTAGAGIEYALWTNWSIKGEYLYVDLGKFDCGISCGAATDNVSFKANLVRLGVNYRF
jgi:outer membrane immunogenic protein